MDAYTSAAFLVPCSLTRTVPATPLRLETSRSMVQTEKQLEELGLTLPPAGGPKANYVPCQRVGNLLYLSGHLPVTADGALLTGRIGPASGHKSVEDGYEAAKQVGLNLIATLKQELGDLDRVEQVVKLFGIVQSHEDFKEQHLVVNGCSDLLVQVFGKERGMHARSAIGTNSLPLDISVEIEAIVQFKP
jgi:enamine deaminase RidA (YjgF/YER057c/UK114 family)